MKILVVATRQNVSKLRDRVRGRGALPPDAVVDLLTVSPPRAPYGFRHVYCVEPSLAPGRCLTVAFGPAGPRGKGLRRRYTEALRRARKVLPYVPVPGVLRGDASRYLATACDTSTEVHNLVRQYDYVVTVDPDACPGLWLLGQRVSDVPLVFGARNLAVILRRAGQDFASKASEVAPLPSTELTFPFIERDSRRLLIAPANYAGQGHAWAEAVNRYVPDASAMNFRAGTLRNPFPTRYEVDTPTFKGDLAWRLGWRDHVLGTFTHVVVEANRPIFGDITGTGERSVHELLAAGKQVALLSHGTDSRIPSVHAARERWHPYDAIDPRQLARMERISRANVAFYESFDGPVYVSTPGLLEFNRNGVWLPLVIDVDKWFSGVEPMERDVPIVAHVPSGPQKGSHRIDPVLTAMAKRGVIEYRRLEGVPYAKMPHLYGTADIMVEQFGIADYSVAACEAMASGRVVVSRVADAVRQRVLEETGLELPIVEANPETLEEVIVDLIAHRDRAQEIGRQGRAFVRALHDGRRSAAVLARWLDATPSVSTTPSDVIKVSS